MRTPIIYLASPYTHADPAVRQARFDAACRAAAALIRQGMTIFSPIAHTHAITQCGLPVDWQFWEPHDRRFLELCDELIVLMLDGWKESIGVRAEIDIALASGKSVSLLDPPPRVDNEGVDCVEAQQEGSEA